MPIDLFVQRGAGDIRGDDIIDPLIGSIPVALQRGRKELDEKAQLMQEVTMEVIYRDGLRLGKLIRCNDSFRGSWVGKITGISHRYSDGEVTTSLQVKRQVL